MRIRNAIGIAVFVLFVALLIIGQVRGPQPNLSGTVITGPSCNELAETRDFYRSGDSDSAYRRWATYHYSDLRKCGLVP